MPDPCHLFPVHSQYRPVFPPQSPSGTKRKFKNLGALENCHCTRCNNTSDWNFMEYRDWFTLFWIPVFPISGRKEYLECPICRQVYDVPKD